MKKNKLLKVILFLTICPLTVLPGKAQSSDKPVSFGIRLGTNSSGFTHNYEVFTEKKMGFTGGAFAEVKPDKMFGFSLELNYQQIGAFHLDPAYLYPAKEITIGNFTKVYSDVTLHSLNIPLLFNFRPVTEGNITPRIILGFQYEYLISAKTKNLLNVLSSVNNQYSTLPKRENDDVRSSFKKFNYGPVAGIGIDFKSTSLTYFFEARYSVGLYHINDMATLNNVTSNYNNYDFSSNTLSIVIGIGF